MTGSLRVTLPTGRWRAGPPPPVPLPVLLDEEAELGVQLIRRTLRAIVDQQDRPTGWVTAEGWWHRPGEPAGGVLKSAG